MNLIGGDLGGTKTVLRLFTQAGEILREERYDSEAHLTFDEILSNFLRDGSHVSAACFAVAGPVLDATAKVTNLPWVLNATYLSEAHSLGNVRIVNDFYGVAASLSALQRDDLIVLNEGVPSPDGSRAALGAGTGLGEAIVARHGMIDVILPTEGGHTDFGPSDRLQDELLLWLRSIHGHVSWERVVSGPGIVDTYHFLRERAELPVAELDDASQVVALAESGDDEARRAIELFIDCYGAEAGNLALKSLPRGGLYVAGGIAAKNQEWFRDGRFLRSYLQKGRFRALLETIPLFLIRNPHAGLIGACRLAGQLMPQHAEVLRVER